MYTVDSRDQLINQCAKHVANCCNELERKVACSIMWYAMLNEGLIPEGGLQLVREFEAAFSQTAGGHAVDAFLSDEIFDILYHEIMRKKNQGIHDDYDQSMFFMSPDLKTASIVEAILTCVDPRIHETYEECVLNARQLFKCTVSLLAAVIDVGHRNCEDIACGILEQLCCLLEAREELLHLQKRIAGEVKRSKACMLWWVWKVPRNSVKRCARIEARLSACLQGSRG